MIDLSTTEYQITVVNRSLSVKEAAEFLNVSKSYLDKSRLTGDGPIFIKIGDSVSYDLTDLMTYRESKKRTSTSQAA